MAGHLQMVSKGLTAKEVKVSHDLGGIVWMCVVF